jgi:hypothetical protein
MPKSLEYVQSEDLCSKNMGAITMRFSTKSVYAIVGSKKFCIDETPSLIINGVKRFVADIY